jgi:hypothetical protein
MSVMHLAEFLKSSGQHDRTEPVRAVASRRLVVGAAQDPSEVEADHVASEVMMRLGGSWPTADTTRIRGREDNWSPPDRAVAPRIARSESAAVLRRLFRFGTYVGQLPPDTHRPLLTASSATTVDQRRQDTRDFNAFWSYLQDERKKIAKTRLREEVTESISPDWLREDREGRAAIEEGLATSAASRDRKDLIRMLDLYSDLLENPTYIRPKTEAEIKVETAEKDEELARLRAALLWDARRLAALRSHDALIETGAKGAISAVTLFVRSGDTYQLIKAAKASDASSSQVGGSKSGHAERPALETAWPKINRHQGNILGIIVSTTFTPCTDPRKGEKSCWEWYETEQAPLFNHLLSPFNTRPPVVIYGYKEWGNEPGSYELTQAGGLSRLAGL